MNNDFPMPTAFDSGERKEYMTIRCSKDTKEKLVKKIPNKRARAEWLNRVIEHGIGVLEKRLPKVG